MTAESPELIERLRADPDYAVRLFDEFWRLMLEQDASTRPKRTALLKVLREARPDLSTIITDDQAGEGWKRSQLARLLMDPRQAKQASVTRLLGQLAAGLRTLKG